MRVFRYLSPSPSETRAFFVLAFGSFLGQLAAFTLALMSLLAPKPNHGAAALAIGGGLAILFRLGRATWNFDSRRRRAARAKIELEADGLRITNENGSATYVRWTEITNVHTRGGRLEIEFRGKKWSVGAREVQNGMQLTEEILRRTQKKSGKPSNFIPLTPV